MKEKEEELDKLFKKHADDPVNEPVYREADWGAMEQLLDQNKKRGGVIYWLPRLGSVAAILLLTLLAWFMFRPQGNKPKIDNQAATVHSKPNTGTSGASGRHETADSSKQKILTPANLAQSSDHPGAGKKINRSFPYLPEGHAAKKPGNAPANVFARNNTNDQKTVSKTRKDIGTADFNQNKDNNLTANVTTVPGNKKDIGSADVKKNNGDINTIANNIAVSSNNKKDIGQVDVKNDNGSPNATALNTPTGNKKDIGQADGKKSDSSNNIAANAPKPKVKITGPDRASRPVFAVMAIASSDMNGTSPLGGSVGGNVGAMFSVTSGKWTISTGGMYSIKPYQESFADYHTPYKFQTNPTSVGANCRMIDIPLNVNYQVYRKGADKFTLGTGLSSYIILREDYTFNYNNSSIYGSSSSGYGPAGYSVINQNKNIMSILNLDVTYERQINSRFGIVFQPYYKLPLTNVGASQVKLQSTGLAVGLNWNLNTFKKPN